MHIGFNMMSFFSQGRFLERQLGSIAFAVLILQLVVSCGLGYVSLAWLAVNNPFRRSTQQFWACAAGFSGVLFALMALMSVRVPGRHSYLCGVKVPKLAAPWILLVAIQLILPSVSLLGHLSGLLIGYVFAFRPGSLLILPPALVGRLEATPLGRRLCALPGFVPAASDDAYRQIGADDVDEAEMRAPVDDALDAAERGAAPFPAPGRPSIAQQQLYEENIVRLESLGVPRATAAELLELHQGDIDAAIAHATTAH